MRTNGGLGEADWTALCKRRDELLSAAEERHLVHRQRIMAGGMYKDHNTAAAREQIVAELRKLRMSVGLPRRLVGTGGIPLSTPIIGRLLGMHHSTVVLALQRIALRQESAVQGIFEGSQNGGDRDEGTKGRSDEGDATGAASHAGAAAGE